MNAINLDKCVSCGQETGHLVEDHVDSRKTYVEGAGQLCSKCFIEVYKKVHKPDVDTNQ